MLKKGGFAMPTITYQYVYFASGPHVRQPIRSPGGPGGFDLIQTLSGGTLSSGDSFGASAQPSSMTVGSNTYPFSFMNVSGGTGGGVTSFSANAPPSAVAVGSANIVVLVVYAPVGGGGTPGATIDSFDDTIGALINDTFVTVAPDPGGALKKSGNVDGFVASSNAETISALSPTTPTKVDFEHWLTLPNTLGNSPNLFVAQNSSPLALAFYKSPPPPPPPPPLDACHELLEALIEISQHGDTPKLTVAMFNAIKTQLENCVKTKKLTQQQVTQSINAYLGDLNPPPTPGKPAG
jgi:hypothetical protein